MNLTPARIANYDRDGFLVVDGFVSEYSCDALRNRAEELVAAFDPTGALSIFSTNEQTRSSDQYFLDSGDKIRFFFEEDGFAADGNLKQDKSKSINKIGHALHDRDPLFDAFSRSADIAELISSLGLADPLLLQSMYVFKQPHIGGEVTCHQDAAFLYTEPIALVGLWFALEDATIDNGCLWAIPGGHRLGLKSRFVRTGLRDGQPQTRMEVYDPTTWPVDQLVPLEVSKGALIVLDPLLPHYSRANRSSASRHAYTLHVVSGKARYPADNWLQRSESMPLRGFM